MDFRSAKQGDLPKLLQMYQSIIRKMDEDGIQIWDEVYPCAFLSEDIERKRLFVASEGDTILAAFALCDSNDGQEAVSWEQPSARACYLDRLGVNPLH
ncbi:MAG: GNAT family N-acetyltransferase, partial [Oscillospiraceae bacterium]|nr:GNAT family N-acetyltransferase [Oscillospiraceae bacterium]